MVQHEGSTFPITYFIAFYIDAVGVVVYLVTILLQIFAQNKKLRKSFNIWRRYGQNFAALLFGPPCIVYKR